MMLRKRDKRSTPRPRLFDTCTTTTRLPAFALSRFGMIDHFCSNMMIALPPPPPSKLWGFWLPICSVMFLTRWQRNDKKAI
jgi:hypothetical protein